MYAYPEDYQPTEAWEGLLPWNSINGANAKFMIESLISSEGERHVKLNVECYPPGHPFEGYPTIRTVQVDDLDSGEPPRNLFQVMSDVERKLWRTEGTVYGVRNLIFYAIDSTYHAGASDGGVHISAVVQRDEHSANYWNHASLSSAVHRSAWDKDAVVHEILHSFGAVTWDHPLSTQGGHCLVEADVMCYRDNGSRRDLYPLVTPPGCGLEIPTGRRVDCLEAIYFRADHGDGTFLDWWLDEKWNTIGAENRFVSAYPQWDYAVPCSQC